MVQELAKNPLAAGPGFMGYLDGLIHDKSNQGVGTEYVYFKMLSEMCTHFSMQHVLTSVTLTYEASNDLLNVLDVSAVWTDITLTLTDGAVASFTTNGSLTHKNPLPWSRLRAKLVYGGLGTNESELRLSRGCIK